MTAMLRVILATACVAAFVPEALGLACTTISWGIQEGTPVQLPDVWISAGIRDWTPDIFYIHSQCAVYNGIKLNTCDTDVAPSAKFLNDFKVVVHRNGALLSDAVVRATVYCRTE